MGPSLASSLPSWSRLLGRLARGLLSSPSLGGRLIHEQLPHLPLRQSARHFSRLLGIPEGTSDAMLPSAKARSESAGVLPSKLHIAFALAVVKSKPAELSVEDYLNRLRQHIRTKVDDNGVQKKYFDAAGYQAERREEAEAAKTDLEKRVTGYEREIDRLKSELRSAQGFRNVQATPTTRRRKDAPTPGPSSRAQKKPRLENEVPYTPTAATVESALPEDMDILSAVSADGAKLMQHLYQAHKLYQDHVQADRSLAYHLVQASDCLAPLLASVCHRYQQYTWMTPADTNKKDRPAQILTGHDEELTSIFEATARIFMCLRCGLKKLTPETAAQEDRGALVHSFVSSFNHLLDMAKEMTSIQASHEAAATQISKSKKRITTRSSQRITAITQPVSLLIKLLSNFLANMLTVPSGNVSLHQELLEGFLFVLFRRLGNRIYLCTFGHEKRNTVEGDIAAWTEPAERDTPQDAQEQINQRALDLELPILVTLLERGLASAQHHIAPLSSTTMRKQNKSFVAKSGPKPTLESLRAGLSLAAKQKLEHSLVHAIFGDESSDDEMKECLTMPVRQELTEPPQKVEQDVKSWFLGKVWGLVGWQAVLDMK